MEEEDSRESKVVQHEKLSKQETHCKLMKKQQKNEISAWKHSGQHFEVRTASTPLFSGQEISKSLLPIVEDNGEDFNTEPILYNDLVVTSELMSCNEYLPYYRTYASLLETPLDINIDVKHENTEREEGVQSNGCVFKPEYEDEPLKDVGFATGYFPYYRSCEEYFGSIDLPSEVYSCVETEEAETNSTEEIGSEIDCETEEVYEDAVIQENGETSEDTNQHAKSLEFTKSHLLTDSTTEPFDSEISVFDEILSLNQPSSSGYFPYYRTYGKLVLSPVASSNMLCSSEDVFTEFGMEREGSGGSTRDYSNVGYSVC